MADRAGEFGRLERLRPYLSGAEGAVSVGVGDDAAQVRIGGGEVLVCVDAVVEGVHFRRDLSSPADVGWKVMAVNVSDIAAMGGTPTAAVVALHRPATLTEDDIDGFYAGMAEAAEAYGVAIVGGDTVAAGEWAASVTLMGSTDGTSAVRRSGARPGDVVVLCGRLGAAATALWADARSATPHPAHLAAHRRPAALPRSGRALARAGATAMIDVSDGLGADAGHLAVASGCSLTLTLEGIEAAAAGHVRTEAGDGWLDLVLGGGEDFALLATVPAQLADAAVEAVAAEGETTAIVLGEVSDGDPTVWLADGDQRTRIDDRGYDHG